VRRIDTKEEKDKETTWRKTKGKERKKWFTVRNGNTRYKKLIFF